MENFTPGGTIRQDRVLSNSIWNFESPSKGKKIVFVKKAILKLISCCGILYGIESSELKSCSNNKKFSPSPRTLGQLETTVLPLQSPSFHCLSCLYEQLHLTEVVDIVTLKCHRSRLAGHPSTWWGSNKISPLCIPNRLSSGRQIRQNLHWGESQSFVSTCTTYYIV